MNNRVSDIGSITATQGSGKQLQGAARRGYRLHHGQFTRTLAGSPPISLHTDGQPFGSSIFGYEGSSPRLLRVLYTNPKAWRRTLLPSTLRVGKAEGCYGRRISKWLIDSLPVGSWAKPTKENP